MKTFIFLLCGVVVGVFIYTWHNQRKSNTGVRTATTGDFSAYEVATFAGGCFWCTESDFEKTDGVVEVISGYTGGEIQNPTYNQVSGGATKHREAVQVYYDPQVVMYEQLLDVFWRHTDPTDAGGSFGDRGNQYTSAIYYHTAIQKAAAQKSKEALVSQDIFEGREVVTPILEFGAFWVAEDYHQDYHRENPRRYTFYRNGSGRNDFIAKYWGDGLKKAQNHNGKESASKNPYYTPGRDNKLFDIDYTKFTKPTEQELREKLTDIQYRVTQEEGTERPFHNEYWDNKKEGIYVDIISGEPLYSSTDKFDSGTGWPSFLKAIKGDAVTEHDDYKLIVRRTEVRSAVADSHLGHILLDGPESNDRIRHCINSAAIRFVPKEDLEEQGYGTYLSLFE